MTIITKPITEKKKQLEQPLVINECDLDAESAVVPPLYVYRKRNSWVLLLAALLFLSFGIVGSLFVYRLVNQINNRQLKGWCQVPYGYSAESFEAGHPNFNEEFDIDIDLNYASVHVPDFSGGRAARFIHDFNSNMTGIIDVDEQRCFVLPLNRKVVLPPKNMMDLVHKLWNGYYEVDTKLIRNRMRVVVPPVTDLTPLGSFIARECRGKPTYMLVKDVHGKILYKRSADGTDFFTELAGQNMQQIDVVNMAAVLDYEKQQQDAIAHASP